MKNNLPVSLHLDEILKKYNSNQNLIVRAEPGSGKTSILPAAFSSISPKKVLVLQPRRITAIAMAQFVAQNEGWTLGKEVGYQVRFESRFSEKTKLLFITEALLLKKWLKDPTLSDIGTIILDEFHERSLYSDISISLLKELQMLERPDLKIVVMSATLNPKPLLSFLGAAADIEIPGKSFPMEVFYSRHSQLLQIGTEFYSRIRSTVINAFNQHLEGHVLVFLPGVGEIIKLKEQLLIEKPNLPLYILHSRMSLNDQKNTLLNTQERKIILATNIAESSLTVDGVRTVVDSGLVRNSYFDPKTYTQQLRLQRVTKASAKQRAGRAARQGPGQVYRLWTQQDELSQQDYMTPEIHRADLREIVLFLAKQGCKNPKNFMWYDAPNEDFLQGAQMDLINMGCLADDFSLTEIGEDVLNWPLPIEESLILSNGKKMFCFELAARTAVLLSEKDFFESRKWGHSKSDLESRLAEWTDGKSHVPQLEKALAQILKNADTNWSRSGYNYQNLSSLLLASLPHRLCRRRKDQKNNATMATGKGVEVSEKSCQKDDEFFIALKLIDVQKNNLISLWNHGLEKQVVLESLKNQLVKKQSLEFDETSLAFRIQNQHWFRQLQLQEDPGRPATSTETQGLLPLWCQQNLDLILKKNEGFQDWYLRYSWFCKNKKNNTLSGLIDLDTWKLITAGTASPKDVFSLDISSIIMGILPRTEITEFDSLCPEYYISPRQRKFKIDYSEPTPKIEIKLQELFGEKNHPQILGKNIKLVILAPNYRPVQITTDLIGFWKGSYKDVRKDLKARYPKHSWPEDPTRFLMDSQQQ